MKNLITCWTMLVVITSSAMAGPKDKTTTGQQLQADFCKLMERGEAGPIMKMFGSELRSEIDEPVFQRWLAQAKVRLGRVRSMKQKTLYSRMDGGQHQLATEAMVTCEKGELLVAMRATDGRVIGIDLESKLMANWLDKPASTQLYEQVGKQFVREFLMGGKPEKAYRMMHPLLQKHLGETAFNTMCKTCRSKMDASEELKLSVRRTWMDKPEDGKAPTLRMTVAVQNGAIDETCEIKIQFLGLRGHLLGFHFNK